jgi:hypothetical protein
MVRLFKKLSGFIWDKGNTNKNLLKHGVSNQECEEIFFDRNKKLFNDLLHSGKEKRYIIIGKTKKSRVLFIVFTIRNRNIRIVSARDMHAKERKVYEEKN